MLYTLCIRALSIECQIFSSVPYETRKLERRVSVEGYHKHLTKKHWMVQIFFFHFDYFDSVPIQKKILLPRQIQLRYKFMNDVLNDVSERVTTHESRSTDRSMKTRNEKNKKRKFFLSRIPSAPSFTRGFSFIARRFLKRTTNRQVNKNPKSKKKNK